VKFDDAQKRFEVSVRELADAEQAFHQIGFGRGEGWSRLGTGAEIHTHVLNARRARNPAYRAEVHLRFERAVGEWTAVITGRLDGCFEQAPGQWVIEEFKSAHLAGEELRRSGPAFERHRKQLMVYCHGWKCLQRCSAVSGRLVYVDIGSGEETGLAVEYSEPEEEKRLLERLQQLLAAWKAQEAVRRKKAHAASVLPFPHAAPRPGQVELIGAIRRTLEGGGHLLAEAPTGSGKTAASLHPALAAGLAAGRQVVFLTSKTMQQTMAVSALESMNSSGAFRTIQIRAKERMCANDRVFCHEDFCPYARGYPEKMAGSKILDRLTEEGKHFAPEAVFTAAKAAEVCPFEVQLELAARADAVVADYNYVFDPGVALRHLSKDELEKVILVVDEAHNLPDRARQIFSPELSSQLFRELRNRIRFNRGEMFEELTSAVETMLGLLEQAAAILPEGDAIAETVPPKNELVALWTTWEPLFHRYIIWKNEIKLFVEEDPFVEAHSLLQRFVAVLHLFGPGFSSVVERSGEALRLRILCLDPARAVAPVFRSAASTVLLSATLSPARVIQRTLGLEPDRTDTVSLPPPFPKENRKIVIVPRVKTVFSARARNYAPIAQLIGRMAEAHGGNILVLFPSYAFLREIAERLPGGRGQVLVQKSDATEHERREILDALARGSKRGILLFAVLGGMYAEGVDYPGELLTGVFIVSPALPQVSFERELLRRYYEHTEEAGFDYAYLQPGMTRVIQAAGRLIRNETDRGVIALFCQRFLQEPYASRLPRDWYNESPAELVAHDPVAEIRSFFAMHQNGTSSGRGERWKPRQLDLI
jgi:DNA excision repair protein ERCC-2